MKISVVIPCYNEELSISTVIKSLPKKIYEVIVVDNNSTDDTAQISKTLGARVETELERGYGRALKKGFSAVKGDVVATLDGDGQYPGEKILEFAALLETRKLDFISGSRFPLKNPSSLSMTRRIGNFILTFTANLLFGLHLKDSQSGMWIFRRSILDKISLKSNDMPLSEEIKIRSVLHPKIRFAEILIDYKPRIGESKLFPVKHGLINIWYLVKLRLKRR